MKEIKTIGVIGLGYVGLPLALLAEEKGFDVLGVDLSQDKLKKLKNRKPVIDDEIANKRLTYSKIDFSDDFSKLASADIAIVCVPTPVDKNKNPDLTPVKGASVSAAKNLKPGSLLIVESTINPGVCDEVLIPLIEHETNHVIGKTLYIAHCPERINPGDPKWHVGNINRVLGADSAAGLDIAYEFYDNLVDAKIKKMDTIKEAEACKVVENSFRDINIAFVNELAMSFDMLGINVKNVIDGAATKPFAFMAHYPGIGVGGHCIPVDPYYLIEYARGYGFEHEFLSLARSINNSMPEFTVEQLIDGLNEVGMSLKGSRIAVLGLSYKANVADDRESPSYKLINILQDKGATVETYDPYFPEKSTAKSLEKALQQKDAVVIATNHTEFISTDYSAHNIKVLVDGKNCINQEKNQNLTYIYRGIGT